MINYFTLSLLLSMALFTSQATTQSGAVDTQDLAQEKHDLKKAEKKLVKAELRFEEKVLEDAEKKAQEALDTVAQEQAKVEIDQAVLHEIKQEKEAEKVAQKGQDPHSVDLEQRQEKINPETEELLRMLADTGNTEK